MTKNRYVPTTEDVSRRYMFGCWEEYNDTSGDYRAEFDRWLAKRDQKLMAQAWEEGVADRDRYDYPENPYRQGETE